MGGVAGESAAAAIVPLAGLHENEVPTILERCEAVLTQHEGT